MNPLVYDIAKLALGGVLPRRSALGKVLQPLSIMAMCSAFFGLSLAGLTGLALFGAYHALTVYGLTPVPAALVIFVLGCCISMIALMMVERQREKLLDSCMSVAQEGDSITQMLSPIALAFLKGLNEGIVALNEATTPDTKSEKDTAAKTEPLSPASNGHARPATH